jgi:hypothetical protein
MQATVYANDNTDLLLFGTSGIRSRHQLVKKANNIFVLSVAGCHTDHASMRSIPLSRTVAARSSP